MAVLWWDGTFVEIIVMLGAAWMAWHFLNQPGHRDRSLLYLACRWCAFFFLMTTERSILDRGNQRSGIAVALMESAFGADMTCARRRGNVRSVACHRLRGKDETHRQDPFGCKHSGISIVVRDVGGAVGAKLLEI